MSQNNMYIPMKAQAYSENKDWVYTSLNISYIEAVRRGVFMWCVHNIKGHWTIVGDDKFGFEDGGDAVMFRMQFGFV